MVPAPLYSARAELSQHTHDSKLSGSNWSQKSARQINRRCNTSMYGTKDGDVIQSVYIDKDALGDVPPATLQVVISPQ